MKNSLQESAASERRKVLPQTKRPALLVLLVGALLWLGDGDRATAGPGPSENQVKAACLLNFPKYVEWPATAFAQTNSPIIVAIIGNADLASAFEKISAGKIINGHPVVLTTTTGAAHSTNNCHILFISATARRTAETLRIVQGQNILTVSDEAEFLAHGGVIRLVRRDLNVRLEVNLTAATAAQLKISSKLLSLADVVKGDAK